MIKKSTRPALELIDRPAEEYQNLLAQQLDKIQSDCANFDAGKHHFAPEIAIKLRVLLYDKPNKKSNTPSVSLLAQLDMLDQEFFDSESAFTGGDPNQFVGPNSGMAYATVLADSGERVTGWQAHLLVQNGRPWHTRPFRDWWEAHVITTAQGPGFSRRSIVTAVANHDSGGHVAPKIEKRYFDLTRADGHEYAQSDNVDENNNPIWISNRGSGIRLARAVVRQIAHETLITLLPDRDAYIASIPDTVLPKGLLQWAIFYEKAPEDDLQIDSNTTTLQADKPQSQ